MLSAEPTKAITLRAQTVSAQPKCSGGTSPNNAAAGDAWWPAPDMVAASGLPAAPARCCSSARPDLRSSSTRTAPARSIPLLALAIHLGLGAAVVLLPGRPAIMAGLSVRRFFLVVGRRLYGSAWRFLRRLFHAIVMPNTTEDDGFQRVPGVTSAS